MTRGRVLPVNSRVRRRLFDDDPQEVYAKWDSNEAFNKVTKTEYIARTLNDELILKGMKWNFDFQTEMVMHGHMKWYRKGSSNEWVVMEPSGRNIKLGKRSREEGLKFTNEGERSKVRRLSPQVVAQRRGFFTDGKILNRALRQASNENMMNLLNENPPPFEQEYFDYVSSTDDDDINNGEEKQDEASDNIEDKNEVETNDAGLTDTIEMEKDANDNQEPSISEESFQKLHIEDEDSTDIKEKDEAKPNDMKNMNEATPKNEKNKAIAEEMVMPKLRAKKKLDTSRY